MKVHRIKLNRLLQLQFDNLMNRRNIIFQNLIFFFCHFVNVPQWNTSRFVMSQSTTNFILQQFIFPIRYF